MNEAEQEPYDKTEMNAFVQNLYDQKMREGKHGHYETMFHVVHQAIKRVHPAPVNQALQAITDFDQMREATEVLARRIKELEAELMEQARVNGMGGEREAKLMARVERLEAVVDVALEALEMQDYGQNTDVVNKLKEVRREAT